MPIINNYISYSDATKNKIAEIKVEPGYSHTRWKDEDLEQVRSEIRNFYRREQRGSCVYCRGEISLRGAMNASVEHIAPKSLYVHFMFEPKNLCVICADCNEYKSNREVIEDLVSGNPARKYPTESARYRIVHPHIDEYNEHIVKAGFIYMERTKKGGHTIYLCNLNRWIHNFGVSDELLAGIETLTEWERFHGN